MHKTLIHLWLLAFGSSECPCFFLAFHFTLCLLFPHLPSTFAIHTTHATTTTTRNVPFDEAATCSMFTAAVLLDCLCSLYVFYMSPFFWSVCPHACVLYISFCHFFFVTFPFDGCVLFYIHFYFIWRNSRNTFQLNEAHVLLSSAMFRPLSHLPLRIGEIKTDRMPTKR